MCDRVDTLRTLAELRSIRGSKGTCVSRPEFHETKTRDDQTMFHIPQVLRLTRNCYYTQSHLTRARAYLSKSKAAWVTSDRGEGSVCMVYSTRVTGVPKRVGSSSISSCSASSGNRVRGTRTPLELTARGGRLGMILSREFLAPDENDGTEKGVPLIGDTIRESQMMEETADNSNHTLNR